MRLIDADKLKRKAQKVGTEAWLMKQNAPIETTLNQFIDWIENAPTIEQSTWIPCSERLPEDSGDYFVRPSDSVLEDYSDFSKVMIMPYDADCEAFGWWIDQYDPISLGFVDSDFEEFKVLAWMPLPKPWEGVDDDSDNI